MNGYAVIADNYRSLLERGEIDIETAEREIKIYDFLASCDTNDLCSLVDSSALNNIIAAFLEMAAVNAWIDEITQRKTLEQLFRIFESKRAKEVLEIGSPEYCRL